MKLFENGVGRPTNEIKKKRKIFIVTIAIVLVVVIVVGGVSLSNLQGAANGEVSLSEQRKAVLDVARAYLAQGKQIQYDSYRKNLNCTPEDSTSKHTCYTVCSGLTYMSYYQALGKKIPDTTEGILDYAEKHKDKDYVVFYHEGKSTSKKAFRNFLESKNLKSKVLPGDILIWTGHVMLVESVNKNSINVIHATGKKGKGQGEDGEGGRYDYSTHEDFFEEFGAIETKTISKMTSARERVAIIRFITSKGKLTAAALTRNQYPSIDIGKIINNVENQSYATVGDKLVYQLRIRNKSKETYKNINVVENIDTNLSVVKAEKGKIIENQIKWTIPEIKPGKYVTLYYTAKVKENTPNGTIIVSTGKVGNIATSRIETLVNKELSASERTKLKKCFKNYSKCFADYKKEKGIKNLDISTSRKFINTLYQVSFGIDLGISDLKNLNVIKNDKLDSGLKKYLYSNFFGSRIGEKTENNNINAEKAWDFYPKIELSDRARTIDVSILQDGDVILPYIKAKTENDMTNKGYIYFDKTLYRYRPENKKFETIKGNSLVKFLRDLVGENYIILRPYVKNLQYIKISKLPTKISYVKGESKLDLSGGKLLLKYDDGSEKEISLKNENIKISGFKSENLGKNKITINYKKFKTTFDINIISKKSITKTNTKKGK